MIPQQYSCLAAGFNGQDVQPVRRRHSGEMVQIGQARHLLNEMIIYGALKACTNAYYGGTGTTVATVNGGLTLGLIRRSCRTCRPTMPNRSRRS